MGRGGKDDDVDDKEVQMEANGIVTWYRWRRRARALLIGTTCVII